MKNDFINIVMLICNRPRLTAQALDSLERNTWKYNLTIVDDSTKFNELPTRFQYAQIIHNPKPGCIGAGRNAGIQASQKEFGKGQALYLSDNDVYFKPRWDQVLLVYQRLHGREVKIIGGGCHPYLQPKDYIAQGDKYNLTSRDAISGYSWLLEWDTWDKFGPFVEHAVGVRQSEDWEYCQRVIQAGYLVGSVMPEVVLHTGVTDTNGKLIPGADMLYAQEFTEGVIVE